MLSYGQININIGNNLIDPDTIVVTNKTDVLYPNNSLSLILPFIFCGPCPHLYPSLRINCNDKFNIRFSRLDLIMKNKY